MMKDKEYDIFIIGGGINGAGIARDASGRGYKVGLAEMKDLGWATSSASTKLIHGGLRYLEQYAFSLVREALIEREIIYKIAPHLVRPLRFLLPYKKGGRPFWLLRAGLFLYDHIGGRKEFLPTYVVDFHKAYRNVLKEDYERGFEYSDAQVDDSRLVIANARHAKKMGADIMVGWRVVRVLPKGKFWQIILTNEKGEEQNLQTSYIVNAAGPWLSTILHDVFAFNGHPELRLVKGSHIVVPSLFSHERAYIFQNDDGRVIFAIPYHDDFTLIGTTDVDYKGDPACVHIGEEEVLYLCNAVNTYFKKAITKEDVVWSYAGVRPLYDNGVLKAQETTRDYILKETKDSSHPPVLNIFGGKITTYRKLAEDALQLIEKTLPARGGVWTDKIALPGGDFLPENTKVLEKNLRAKIPGLSEKTYQRLIRNYGTEALDIFKDSEDSDKINQNKGQHFGHELYEKEVVWMIKKEWAKTVEDVLWRRSKLGLYFTDSEIAQLEEFLKKFYNEKMH